MSNTATLKNAKIVDPNILKIAFYDLEEKKYIHVGRGIKKFNADQEFSFYTIDNPDGSKSEVANFCLASCTFDYGKEKQKIMFFAYGPPARVLDAVLKETDQYYHEDIIDWFTSKKLTYLEQNIDRNNIKDAKEKMELAIDALFEGFEKRRKAAGKNPPKYFKRDMSMLSEAVDWKQRLIKEETKEFEKKLEEVDHITPQTYIKNNPLAFKSAATKEVVDEKIYQSLTPAEILTQRIALTNTSIPQLANALKFDISTVYHHIRGTRDVDRKAALRYASFFNCDPADILFPPIKIPLTGTCDFLKSFKDLKPCEVEIKFLSKENVLCPRDFYTSVKEIKAIKINSPSSVYDNHVAYYYYSEKKETDCENKICFIGVDNGLTILQGSTDYYIGIYENYRGITKILNPDPFRNKEVILENPKIKFITPIIGIVNIDKVQFSPVVEVGLKALSANDKLKKLEKDLELAEDQWWLENQKLSGKNISSRSKAAELDRMFKELKKKRLEVEFLRRTVLTEELNKKHKNMDERLSTFIEDLYYSDEQKTA